MTPLAAVLLGVGVLALRLSGMFVAGPLLRRRPGLVAATGLVPVAVVTALVAQVTFGDGRSLVLDARAVGLGVAAVLVWRRAPFIVVVVVAAATTALVRAF